MNETQASVNPDWETDRGPVASQRVDRDWVGSLIGLAVFLAGVYLIYSVFILAKEMFLVPPKVALQIAPGKPMDVNATGNSAVGIVLRFLLLLLMAATGSIIANRGIFLYSRSRGFKK